MLPSTPPFNTVKPRLAEEPDSTFTGYGKSLIALHWLMVILFIAVYASIELRVLFAKGTEMRDFMKSLHFMMGLYVLLMVILRIVSRKISDHPSKQTQQGMQAAASILATMGQWHFMRSCWACPCSVG
jgi:cytochrome b561